jgi:hypothetical protein
MEIRPYQTGDEYEIVKLFKTSFQKEMTLDYWRWRFWQNPFCDEKYIHLMWEKGELIGHYAISPIELIINDQVFQTGLSMTTMTHPQHTGKGIFSLLANSVYQQIQKRGFKMVWGFPNYNSHHTFIKNLNWKDIAIVPMLKLKANFLKMDPSGTINYVESEVGLSNIFVSMDGKISLNKTDKFFKWRYFDNPESQYQIIVNKENNSSMVFKLIKSLDNQHTFDIDIMEVTLSSENDLRKLITFIINSKSDKTVDSVNTWINIHSDNFKYFEKVGFKYEKPLTFFSSQAFENKTFLEDIRNWELSFSYSDVF